MVAPVIEIGPGESCQKAAQLMRDYKTGALAITVDQHILEGMITDRDLAVRCMAEGGDPSVELVGDFCDINPSSIYPEADLEQAAEIMRTAGVRRLPVVEDSNRIVGMLSLDDVALDLKRYFDAFAEISAQYRRT
jgi:CBS domain-containing protein